MPRIARFIRDNQPTVYHIVSRTALQGLPIKERDNDFLLGLISKLSRLYFVDVLGFALLGNHFHLVVRVHPESEASDDEVKKRLEQYYGDQLRVMKNQIGDYRKRLTDLGAYVKDIKQGFTRYFNKKYGRRGFFWGERFKSMIVQDGMSLVNLLAYVDLNPIRAGIVKKPEDYRWCSLGYHVQTGNRDGLLDIDFGLKVFNDNYFSLSTTIIIPCSRSQIIPFQPPSMSKDSCLFGRAQREVRRRAPGGPPPGAKNHHFAPLIDDNDFSRHLLPNLLIPFVPTRSLVG
jgi:REP element-mobilizing transposase RayT